MYSYTSMYTEYNYKYMSTIKILLYNEKTLLKVCILNIITSICV